MSGAIARFREERQEEFWEVVGEGAWVEGRRVVVVFVFVGGSLSLRRASRRLRRDSFRELLRRGSLRLLLWVPLPVLLVGEGGEWYVRAPMSPVSRRERTAGWGAGVG